jgi:membrane-bound ClpP family serine protease
MPEKSSQQPVMFQEPRRSTRGPLIAGIVLLLVGFYFLLERFDLLPPIATSWPVILMIVGAALIIGYLVSLAAKR